MKFHGIQIQEGSDISNLTVASGTSFPGTPNEGELFFRSDVAVNLKGLYCYIGGTWDRIASTDSLTAPSGTTLPSVANAGDLFYKNSNDGTEGLYAYNDSTWVLTGGGTPVSAPATQVLFGTGTGFTSDTNLKYDADTGAFSVNPSGSVSSPGIVQVQGPGGSTSGGQVIVSGGPVFGSGTAGNGVFKGGNATSGGTPGTAILQGGAAIATGSTGGNAEVRGGTANNGNGGQALLSGADGVGTNRSGGSIIVTPGAKTGAGTAGSLNLVFPSGSHLKLDGASGSAGQVLSSNGSTSAPTWITPTNSNITLSGDVSGSGTTSIATTLAIVNSNVGSFGSASTSTVITVNAKGLVTAASTTPIQILESQITDGSILARVSENETIGGTWSFTNAVAVGSPTAANSAATKQYVDLIAQGLVTKPSVAAASTANISGTYNNGTAGVGATVTGVGALPAIDGVTLAAGNGILLKNQTSALQNGRYVVTTLSPNYVLTRCGVCDEATEIPAAFVFVNGGTQAQTGWVQTVADVNTFTVGTDAISVTQFSAAGAFIAGAGLTLSGNTFDVGTASTSRIVVNADNIDLATVSNSGTGTFLKVAADTYGRITGTTAVLSSDVGALVDSRYLQLTGGTITGDLVLNRSGSNPAYIDLNAGAGGLASGLHYDQASLRRWFLGTIGFDGDFIVRAYDDTGTAITPPAITFERLNARTVISNVLATGSLTGAASLNVLKAGDTMSGRLYGTSFRAAQGVPGANDLSANGFAFAGDGDTGVFSPIVGSGGASNGVVGLFSNSVEGLRVDGTVVTIPGSLTVTGAFTGSVTGASSLNVLKAGDTMTGSLNNTVNNAIGFSQTVSSGASSGFSLAQTGVSTWTIGNLATSGRFEIKNANRVLLSTQNLAANATAVIDVDTSGNISANESLAVPTPFYVGSRTNYLNYFGAETLHYTGGTTQYGIVMKPASSALATSPLVFLSSASTSAVPVVVGTIEQTASNAAMNLTGNWLIGGQAIATVSNSVQKSGDTMTGNLTVATTTGPALLVTSPAVTTNVSAYRSDSAAGSVYFGRDTSTGGLTGVANSAIIWNSSATPLVLGTNGAERMRIDSAGNVGVGTASPTSILDARIPNSFSTVVNNSTLNDNTLTALRVSMATDPVSAITAGTGVAISLSATPGSGEVFIVGTHASTSKDAGELSIWTTSAGVAAEAVRVSSTGNVGVGTTGPGRRLHVIEPTFAGVATFESRGSTQAALQLKNNTSSTPPQIVSVGDDLYLQTSGADRFRILADGKIGIGTSGPTFQLDVVAPASSGVRVTANSVSVVLAESGSAGFVGTNTSHPLKLVTGGNERMRIDTNGDLLVGGTANVNNAKLSVDATGTKNAVVAKVANNTYSLFQGFSSTTTLAFQVNGAGEGYLSSKLGIGISTPSVALQVQNNSASDGIIVRSTSFNMDLGGAGNGLLIGSNYNNGTAYIVSSGNATTTTLVFATCNNAAPVERMRLTNSGNLLIGNATDANARVRIDFSGQSYGVRVGTTATTGVAMQFVYESSTQVGSISTTTTTTSYNTSSDIRLKTNIADAGSASSLIDAIRIREFDFKIGGHVPFGVIAQELHTVVPEAVCAGDDGDDVTSTWAVDYSKLVPLLVKEIQELRARVAALEAK